MIQLPRSRYEIIRRLGRGGTGEVFLARDHHLGTEVALKRLHSLPGPEGRLELLEREFALLSGIDHPGIARAYDFGYLDGAPFFTSEYVPGKTLSDLESVVDAGRLLDVATSLVETVRFLHRGEILHLDIKPGNIIMAAERSGRESSAAPVRPVLIDFGLVRRGFDRPPPDVLRGSVPYMAPEYFRGEGLAPWTDVYAIGVTLYRLATGGYPRQHDRGRGDGSGFLAEPEWCPVTRVPAAGRLPRGLESVILRCLALDPRMRFASGAELLGALEALEHVGRGPSGATAPTPPAIQIVGRQRELAALDRFLDSFDREGEAPVLVVTGTAGSGQSHLFRELKVRAQTGGRAVYLESLYPGSRCEPGQLLACLLNHLAGTARSRWARFLSRLRRPRGSVRHLPAESERRIRWAPEVAAATDAVREPLLVAVDGLQFCDEISLELLVHLIEMLGGGGPSSRPPIGVVLGYREEGPLVSRLGELTRHLLEPGRAAFLTLQGLSVEETLELHRRLLAGAAPAAGEDGRSRGLELFQRSGGIPRKIVALSLRAEDGGETVARAARAPEEAPSPTGRRLLLALVLMERPATVAELCRVLGLRRGPARALVRDLADCGLARAVEDGARERCWLPGPAAPGASSASSPLERRRLHRAIGEQLARGARGDPRDPRLAEAVRHFHAAGDRKALLEHGLAVARYQRSTFQGRLSLASYHAVFESLPRTRLRTRVEVALEIADLHARIGDLDEGIHFLRAFLFGELKRRTPGGSRAGHRRKVLLGLAMLYSRRGDFRRADALFREGLEKAGRSGAGSSRLPTSELLHFLNEHAALKVFLGDLNGAVALCERGLDLAAKSRSPGVHEVVLNLHATRANVALRRFDFETAVRDFETALEIAESIGSPVNQAVILNNLGTVYGQSDRFREAIRAFRDAERTCRQLDEGPSLASICANLGILHAKTGDFARSDAAFAEAGRLESGAIGRRERFLLAHARGLASLYRGRYADARAQLEDAIALGESLGDRLVVLFEKVSRGEALIFEARYNDAAAELSALVEPSCPPAVRRMAVARLAFLASLLGQGAEIERRLDEYAALDVDRALPFVEAWDGLFLAWAAALAGSGEVAAGHLDGAESYFRRHRLRAGTVLAGCIRSESLLVRGEEDAALDALPPAEEPGSDLTRTVRSLLEARLRLVSDPERAGDLLAHASSLLAANPLPEWQARCDLLRSCFDTDVDAESASTALERGRREIAGRLSRRMLPRYLRSPHWRAWQRSTAGRPRAGPRARTRNRRAIEPARTETVALAERRTGGRREGLVTESSAMARLVSALDRVRDSDLPVIISGETGTGKELAARIIHEEGSRRGGPFQVVDCAAIPEPLLQVELFGARAGAFTDGGEDRTGILELARGGTVFVDEVGNTSLQVQASLLRVISEKSMRPLGAEEETPVDLRFLLSTSLDLEKEVRAGRFRADLYHRIHVLTVRVPPLRERLEDLPGLIERLSGPPSPPTVEDGVLERLRAHTWPGNVRELRNLLLRLRLDRPERITLEAVERALGGPATSTLFPRSLLAGGDIDRLKKQLERDYLVFHFRRLGGDSATLCRFLGLTRRQLYNRCERLEVSLREERRRMRRASAERPGRRETT